MSSQFFISSNANKYSFGKAPTGMNASLFDIIDGDNGPFASKFIVWSYSFLPKLDNIASRG